MTSFTNYIAAVVRHGRRLDIARDPPASACNSVRFTDRRQRRRRRLVRSRCRGSSSGLIDRGKEKRRRENKLLAQAADSGRRALRQGWHCLTRINPTGCDELQNIFRVLLYRECSFYVFQSPSVYVFAFSPRVSVRYDEQSLSNEEPKKQWLNPLSSQVSAPSANRGEL